MALSLPAQSTIYLKTRITATVDGTAYDPTADQVAFAFLPEGTGLTANTTWYPGSWETANGLYYARCLVGPNVSSTAGWPSQTGSWDVWVKVVGNPEAPVLPVDVLIVE